MFQSDRLNGEMQKSDYRVLGVEATATPAEIKAAVRSRAMEVHRNASGSENIPSQALLDAQYFPEIRTATPPGFPIDNQRKAQT
jgi:curved DNA-binding protein CbpA